MFQDLLTPDKCEVFFLTIRLALSSHQDKSSFPEESQNLALAWSSLVKRHRSHCNLNGDSCNVTYPPSRRPDDGQVHTLGVDFQEIDPLKSNQIHKRVQSDRRHRYSTLHFMVLHANPRPQCIFIQWKQRASHFELVKVESGRAVLLGHSHRKNQEIWSAPN